MLVRSWIRAGVATVVLAGAAMVATATIPVADAATPACGSGCTAIATQAYGPGDVTAVGISGLNLRKVTTTIVLAAASPETSEDFVRLYAGTVAQFYAAGIIGAALDQLAPTAPVYEYEPLASGTDTSLVPLYVMTAGQVGANLTTG